MIFFFNDTATSEISALSLHDALPIFSFVLAPAVADPVLDLDNVVHWLICFCFFLIWKVFAFVLFGSLHAAICCLQAASALIPMAQIKPNSSRAIAVMVFLCSLPLPTTLMS